jgi:hypothetical protein
MEQDALKEAQLGDFEAVAAEGAAQESRQGVLEECDGLLGEPLVQALLGKGASPEQANESGPEAKENFIVSD